MGRRIKSTEEDVSKPTKMALGSMRWKGAACLIIAFSLPSPPRMVVKVMLTFESSQETKGWEWKRKTTKQLRKTPESREQNDSLNMIPGF